MRIERTALTIIMFIGAISGAIASHSLLDGPSYSKNTDLPDIQSIPCQAREADCDGGLYACTITIETECGGVYPSIQLYELLGLTSCTIAKTRSLPIEE
ncbi:hypothetical protein [Chitinophaga niabensis]|uniref:Uncharacterized protein n=1 Tax=Chitinophaga niabensis TaxID=536979 RepID=A0A1N6KAK6_9BACT|nr:hypothetical protein [Chitinophaga niabensis]SIO53619.1 hypothetical protein SAMN04488055_5448 [Chitinophaga niabensis]